MPCVRASLFAPTGRGARNSSGDQAPCAADLSDNLRPRRLWCSAWSGEPRLRRHRRGDVGNRPSLSPGARSQHAVHGNRGLRELCPGCRSPLLSGGGCATPGCVPSPRRWISLSCSAAAPRQLATLLFTYAFTYDHPNTPVLLQQAQPLSAVAGAADDPGERLQRRYSAASLGRFCRGHLKPSLTRLPSVGVDGWSRPPRSRGRASFGPRPVLGRRLGAKRPSRELTALRVATGLVAAVVALAGERGSDSLTCTSARSSVSPPRVFPRAGRAEPAR